MTERGFRMAARSRGAVSAARLGSASAGAAAGAALVLTLSGAARADDAQEFELAKTRYNAGQYEEAAERFAAMLDPENPPCDRGPSEPGDKPCRITDPDLIARARSFAAASLVALQRTAEADAYIEKILLDNPTFTPDPAVPIEVVDRITAVRARIGAQIEAAAKRKADAARAARLAAQKAREEERRWIADLSQLAGRETIVERRSRWVALLPFGAGQFQNGDTALGWTFLISEALMGSASVVSAVVVAGYEGVDTTAKSAPAAAGEAESSVDVDQLNNQIATATAINRVAFGAWAAITVAGIIHAQVTFVPQVTTYRPRTIPPPPPSFTARPSVAVLPGGVSVGLSGRF
jgi:tetratricopeptide (TPR) repeat protein